MIEPRKKKILIIALSALLVVIAGVILTQLTLKKEKKPPVRVKPEAKIAMVIDDWGYSLENAQILSGFRFPLTCAVLPNLPASGMVARKLHQDGFEVILHLPMQPKENLKLEKDTILVSMDKEAVAKIVAADLKSLGYATGASNHMGSRLTEDKRSMTLVLQELKKKNVYFLDSFVSAKSVAFSLARQMGLRCAKRDIFLDNRDDPDYIRGQLNKLKKMAKMRGQAIGIGHARKNTLKVFREIMPLMKKEGYRFVFVSELAK